MESATENKSRENQMIAVFENPVFGQVRWLMRDGEPWFIAKDICEGLGYANSRDATSKHCKHAELFKGSDSLRLDSPYGANIIPESDLYRLIMKSNMPGAEAFQDWIAEEVLPAIRKTGKYALSGQPEGSYSFEKIQPLAMLEAIFSYVGLENRNRAEILDKIWKGNFGYSALSPENYPEKDSQNACEKGENSESACENGDNSDLGEGGNRQFESYEYLTPSQIGKLLSPRRTGKAVTAFCY